MLFGTRQDSTAERGLIEQNPAKVDQHIDRTDNGLPAEDVIHDVQSRFEETAYSGINLRRILRFATVISLDIIAIIILLVTALVSANILLNDVNLRTLAQNIGFLSLFGVTAAVILISSGLYARSWRFLSHSDMLFLTRTVAIALTTAWVISLIFSPGLLISRNALLWIAPTHAISSWAALAFMRICRRGLRQWRRRQTRWAMKNRKPVLLLGDLEWACNIIDLVQRDKKAQINIQGIISSSPNDLVGRVAGVPVLGTVEMLPGILELLHQSRVNPSCIIIRDGDKYLSPNMYKKLLALTRDTDLEIHKFRDPLEQITSPDIRPRAAGRLETIEVADLLGRPELELERGVVRKTIVGRKILITGAGGSIGSELVRQIAAYDPAEIILLENCEFNLFTIDMEIREKFPKLTVHPALCCIRQKSAVRQIFEKYRPDIVFHAAALKHVPLVELNPCAGAHTNIIGTRNIADAMCEFGAEAMVLISTDKAVNPVGTMGGTKRLSELYCQALDLCGEGDEHAPRLITVRFGNVLGSSGSLIPLFQKQLAEGKALTITDPEMERFFMTIQEAVQLVLHSSAQTLDHKGERGHLFVLDMGKPVKIIDIAKRMIQLAGLEDRVPIKFIGLRPGEKLYEELFDNSEEQFDVDISGVFGARTHAIPLSILWHAFDEMERHIENGNGDAVCNLIRKLIVMASDRFSDFMFPDHISPDAMEPQAGANITMLNIGRKKDGLADDFANVSKH